MKRFMPTCSMLLLFVFLTCCKGQDQTYQPNDGGNQIKNNLPHIPKIAEIDTIITPNAPRRITRKIRNDKEGNLLIAAYEDIIRYDGASFTILPKETSLKSFDAFDVLEDSKGNIWIASTHLGVFRYDGRSFIRFTTDDGLTHNRAMCIYEDKSGNIWIGGQGGASCFDGKSFRNFTTNEGLTNNDVNTIVEDKTGKIWFGTRGSVCVYDPSNLSGSAGKSFTEIKGDQGELFTNIWSIIEDKKGDIWMGGADGLWHYDGHSFKNFSKESVASIYEDKNGKIWTTNPGGVLSLYEENSRLDKQITVIEIFKSGGMLFGISEDKIGNIWIGSLNGVYRYDGNTVSYFNDN